MLEIEFKGKTGYSSVERRVVITGIGAVTPLGLNFGDTWRGLINGRQGVRRLRRENLQGLPYVMAGEVDGFERVSPFTEKEKRRLDQFIQYLVVSAIEAVSDAGISGVDAPVVIFGSSRGGVTGMEMAFSSAKKGLRPSLMISTMIGMGVSAVAEKLGIRATGYGVSSACASGAIAVGQAFRAVKSGDAEVAITGGADAPITRFCLEGYGAMGLLSKRADPTASRPFSMGRDGFVLAEGGVGIVIEELGHALNRGARIYAEIKGFDTFVTPE
ncbi:MAG: beta-ketoacyl-[acyl-carrier-protein] synthase II, partial [Nitrospirae bacterium]